MKLTDIIILENEQLNEISLKSIAAGAIGVVGGIAAHNHKPDVQQNITAPTEIHQSVQQKAPPKEETQDINPKYKSLIDNITKRYNVDTNLATEIVQLAHKYEKPVFPKAKDLIALMGVESAFDPNAVSGLKHDPARGLLQVRPAVWHIDPADLRTPEDQIKIGSDILALYYKKLKNKDAAIQAYNVGLTNYLNGDNMPNMVDASTRYLDKYYKSLSHYNHI